MRHKKIKDKAVKILEDVIKYIKKPGKRKNMPFKKIGALVNILFPKTRHLPSRKGRWKHVFVIHSGNKKFVLKMGSKRSAIRKDFTTYKRLCRKLGSRKANRNFAKIYWAQGLFMLQKYGKKVKVPEKELKRLKEFGKSNYLKDIRKDNIMKFGNQFKIVDAERRRKRSKRKKHAK